MEPESYCIIIIIIIIIIIHKSLKHKWYNNIYTLSIIPVTCVFNIVLPCDANSFKQSLQLSYA